MKTLRIAVLVASISAVLWSSWIMVQRRLALREWEARQDRLAHPAPSAGFNRTFGGADLKILDFYATGGVRKGGDPTLLCYGVLNAKSVRIDPPVPGIYPTLSKCVEVRPEKETRYKLTAEDAAGHTASASVVVPVGPGRGAAPAPEGGTAR